MSAITTNTMINRTGSSISSRKSYPDKLSIKIITSFPDKTASANCHTLILERPATTFTSAEGVKGKQSIKNKGAKPCRSTQFIIRLTFSCLLKKFKKRFRPNFRTKKNTSNAPADEPIHEYKKPNQSPNELAFAITNRIRGKNGKKPQASEAESLEEVRALGIL